MWYVLVVPLHTAIGKSTCQFTRTGVLWFVSSHDSKTEMRGTASVVATAFPVLAAVTLAMDFFLKDPTVPRENHGRFSEKNS